MFFTTRTEDLHPTTSWPRLIHSRLSISSRTDAKYLRACPPFDRWVPDDVPWEESAMNRKAMRFLCTAATS
ncbi:MAG TPA: hypothetical protein VF960_14855, partial [Chloroflexota bacterium]